MQRKRALRKEGIEFIEEKLSFVCMNSQISALIKAGDTKFVMKVPVYHMQLELILSFVCLASQLS